MEEIDITPKSNSNPNPIVPEQGISSSIDALNRVLSPVRAAFVLEKKQVDDKIQIFLWSAIPIAVFLFTCYVFALAGDDLLLPDFDTDNTLKTWYQIALRFVFVSMLISFIIYCLKMLKNYLVLSEQLSHKIAIINSIPAILYANEDDKELFNTCYIKIVDVLVKGINLDQFSPEHDSNVQSGVINLLKALK